MQYFITFLEGIISFISPCMLPMLPVYISYFAGNSDKKHSVITRSVAFVLGFTAVFCMLGVFAGAFGAFLAKYSGVVKLVTGGIVIVFGLSYLEVIHLPFFKGMQNRREVKDCISAFLFGLVYSISLTPCVGAFLGSALMLASNSATVKIGFILLLCYSLGLGVPFIISAILLEQLNSSFTFIKKHYRIINTVCGIFLIIVGILMMTGMMNVLMSAFS